MGDLALVTALFHEVEVGDTGTPDTTQDLLRADWEGPSIDLSVDAWVVYPEGAAGPGAQPVGYGLVDGRDQHRVIEAWALVHPGHRGRGIGWHLTDLLAARADEHASQAPPDDSVVLRDGVIAQDQAGHLLLRERGFTPVRHFWRMEASLAGDLLGPLDVPDVRLRTFELGRDDRGVHRAIQESFAEHWGFVGRGFDEWAAHRLHEHGFDPDLWWVAEESDQIVAALCGMVTDRIGYVGMLGVRSPWRKRGIGEALLRHSFLEFRRRGLDTVQLGVDAANETGATALYERVGMHVTRQFDVYEKRLR
jgi:mycothiol synthase